MPHKDPEVRRTYARELARRQRKAKQERDLERRRQQIEARPRWPDVDLAYAAGMFEGEGTITISSGTNHLGNPMYRCIASLTSTDRQIVDFFDQHWPAASIGTRRAKEHHKVAWVWRIQGDSVLRFITDLRPFLRTDAEREKFDVVEEAQWLPRQGSRDPKVKTRMAVLMATIRRLNRRGAPVGSAT